jgi:hypothetical protein
MAMVLSRALQNSRGHDCGEAFHPVSIAPHELWRMLQRCDGFNTFTDHERQAFEHAVGHE